MDCDGLADLQDMEELANMQEEAMGEEDLFANIAQEEQDELLAELEELEAEAAMAEMDGACLPNIGLAAAPAQAQCQSAAPEEEADFLAMMLGDAPTTSSHKVEERKSQPQPEPPKQDQYYQQQDSYSYQQQDYGNN